MENKFANLGPVSYVTPGDILFGEEKSVCRVIRLILTAYVYRCLSRLGMVLEIIGEGPGEI